jgi:Ran GTPase-activating protein (RanGAP) involved in mRNA processing and transport
MLKEAILANPQLYVLKLSYNNLGDDGAAIIASAIFHNGTHRQVSLLDLGFNSIGDMGCGAIALHCLAGNLNLQSLYLTGNQFGEQGALSIAGAILHGTSLKSLHLEANEIGPMGIKAIAGAIVKNEARITQSVATGEMNGQLVRRMEDLYLGTTFISTDGFIAIPGMLLTNTSIQTLSLCNNNLDDQDILLLSQALTQNKLVPLKTLHLSFNDITCQGIECLMNAVWGSTTLREIKLDNNKLKDRGAQLCAVVMTSVALNVLDLGFNRVTTCGIKALMKNLSENSSLRALGLSGIPIDQNASKAVSYALAYNTSLQALYLDNCSTGYASQRHIVAGAVSNRKSSLRVFTGFQLSRESLLSFSTSFISFVEFLTHRLLSNRNRQDVRHAKDARELVQRPSPRFLSTYVATMAFKIASGK